MFFPKISKSITAVASLMLSYSTFCNSVNANEQFNDIIATKQYRANDPIEDRISVGSLQKVKGIAVAVFDGHGGDLCADFAAGNFTKYLNQRIGRNKREKSIQKIIQKSLQEAFDDLQNGFKSIFQKNITNIDYQRVGACALAAVIVNKHIVIANAGDSEGVILGGDKIIKVNQRLNAGQPFEQQRLRKQFPNQSDIIKCIPNTSYCYVKGRLQPTRSLGDFYLKASSYNFTNLSIFTGPYITHKPQISTFELTPRLGKTLIIATDGLWDQLNEYQMDKILAKQHGKVSVPQILFSAAIKKIIERNRINSFQRLNKIDNRRNLHDDISIISVNLQKFINDFNNRAAQ